jgi:phosphoglucomutase
MKLVDVTRLQNEYFQFPLNFNLTNQRVAFGTSGHRGSSLIGTFNESHILAITQAICDYRKFQKITGPLYLGKDTHALSDLAQKTSLEVLVANGVETILQRNNEVTPTPVISRAILVYNRGRTQGLSDGIIITPSHNPPEDGGIKYNATHGGPADTSVTKWIEVQANKILLSVNKDVKRISFSKAIRAPQTHEEDFLNPYISDLNRIVDMDCIRDSGLKIGVDPMGGASVNYWEPIKALYRLNLNVINPKVDPTFSFIPVDHDGKIRTDCSSPYVMAGLIAEKNNYQIAFGNDADSDRHGIVTPTGGLMMPNHFLVVSIAYLLSHREKWSTQSAIGKTLVSSALIDRVVKSFGRKLSEMPVGFKWFAPGLFDASLCFAGEESAGASFLRKDGTVWTTDKDGIIMDLLAAEITAKTGKDPSQHYQELTAEFGAPVYTRIDTPATPEEKSHLQNLSPQAIQQKELAGEPILAKLTQAPGNQAPIGGLKVITENGWFAARPSGTENINKIYAESFKSQNHLDAILREAQQIVRWTQEIL